MNKQAKQLKWKQIIGAALLLILPFLGFGCSKDTAPTSAPATQSSPSVEEKQSVTVEQALGEFKQAAAQGDINAALQQVHPSGKEKINTYLQEMKRIGTLGAFAESLDRMVPVRVGEEIAEYDVFEDGNNEPLTITFMKDNGQWKIRDF